MITKLKFRRIVFVRGEHKTACMHRINKAQCKTKLSLVMEIAGGPPRAERAEGEKWYACRWCFTNGVVSQEIEIHGVTGQDVSIWCRRYYIKDGMVRKELNSYRINQPYGNEQRKGDNKEIARKIKLREARELTTGAAVRYGEYIGKC